MARCQSFEGATCDGLPTLLSVHDSLRGPVTRRVGVHEGGGEFRDCMGECVFGVVGDAVGIGEAGGGVDVEFGIDV